MTVDKIAETLERMRGNRYKFGEAYHKIASFEISMERERIFIYTTAGRCFDRNFEEFEYFIKQWKLANDDEVA